MNIKSLLLSVIACNISLPLFAETPTQKLKKDLTHLHESMKALGNRLHHFSTSLDRLKTDIEQLPEGAWYRQSESGHFLKKTVTPEPTKPKPLHKQDPQDTRPVGDTLLNELKPKPSGIPPAPPFPPVKTSADIEQLPEGAWYRESESSPLLKKTVTPEPTKPKPTPTAQPNEKKGSLSDVFKDPSFTKPKLTHVKTITPDQKAFPEKSKFLADIEAGTNLRNTAESDSDILTTAKPSLFKLEQKFNELSGAIAALEKKIANIPFAFEHHQELTTSLNNQALQQEECISLIKTINDGITTFKKSSEYKGNMEIYNVKLNPIETELKKFENFIKPFQDSLESISSRLSTINPAKILEETQSLVEGKKTLAQNAKELITTCHSLMKAKELSKKEFSDWITKTDKLITSSTTMNEQLTNYLSTKALILTDLSKQNDSLEFELKASLENITLLKKQLEEKHRDLPSEAKAELTKEYINFIQTNIGYKSLSFAQSAFTGNKKDIATKIRANGDTALADYISKLTTQEFKALLPTEFKKEDFKAQGPAKISLAGLASRAKALQDSDDESGSDDDDDWSDGEEADPKTTQAKSQVKSPAPAPKTSKTPPPVQKRKTSSSPSPQPDNTYETPQASSSSSEDNDYETISDPKKDAAFLLLPTTTLEAAEGLINQLSDTNWVALVSHLKRENLNQVVYEKIAKSTNIKKERITNLKFKLARH